MSLQFIQFRFNWFNWSFPFPLVWMGTSGSCVTSQYCHIVGLIKRRLKDHSTVVTCPGCMQIVSLVVTRGDILAPDLLIWHSFGQYLENLTFSHPLSTGFRERNFRLVESLERDCWNVKKIHGRRSSFYNQIVHHRRTEAKYQRTVSFELKEQSRFYEPWM